MSGISVAFPSFQGQQANMQPAGNSGISLMPFSHTNIIGE
jgi:hypothetical protein